MNQLKLFGKRVRSVRKAAKITQEEAAEAAGLNSKYFGEVERGEKQPSLKAILAFAKALRVSPATFFQFEEDTDEKTLRSPGTLFHWISENRGVPCIRFSSRCVRFSKSALLIWLEGLTHSAEERPRAKPFRKI
jgi:DNA-binding XRE family transcriptional regulator